MVPDRTERHRLPGPWPHPEAWRLSRAQSRLHQRDGGIMARAHWENAIAHYDEAVHTFVNEYFGGTERRCLLVAAAGFDPRSRRIAEILASALGNRLQALRSEEPTSELQSLMRNTYVVFCLKKKKHKKRTRYKSIQQEEHTMT